MLRTWSAKYSPCEYVHLDVCDEFVRATLAGFSEHVQTWTHEQVLAGAADPVIESHHGRQVCEELKDFLRSRHT